MSTPPQANKDINSQSDRLRASTSIAPTSPNLLHRTLTGRIGRSRSASSLLSTRNRRTANSETTSHRIWQYNRTEQNPESHLSLPEYIAPQSLAVLPPLTAASAEFNLPSLEAIPRFEETTVLVAESSSLAQLGRSQEGLSSMEFMMPPQYQPHEQSVGHFPSSYLTSNYIDQYSSSESDHAMAQTSSQPSGYATSYATSPPLIGSPNMSQRGGSLERESNPGYQYPSAIRSPPYHSGTTSPQLAYTYSTTQAPSYVPPYSAPSDYAHAQYPPTYGAGHYSSAYQQPHTSGALGPIQHYGSPHDHLGSEDAAGVRIVNDRPKPQCWEHGCNGRQFSTFSNLLRHQREKSGKAQKSNCPKCGAEFTRTTARNGHIAHDKCKKRGRGFSPPELLPNP